MLLLDKFSLSSDQSVVQVHTNKAKLRHGTRLILVLDYIIDGWC